MEQTAVGWLSLPPATQNLSFIPHPRFPSQIKTNSLPVLLGGDLVKDIQIAESRFARSSHRVLPTRLVKTKKGEWRAGPFIAILTSEGPYPFGGNRRNFSDLIQMGRRLGVTVYVLTPSGFTPGSSRVHGWVLRTTKTGKRWIKTTFPSPHVVYNRIPTRKAEMREKEKQVVEYFLSSPQFHLFNPHFFDKWRLHHCLSNHPTLASLLPETCQWREKEKVQEMIKNHDTLYFKLSNGKAGNGMIRLRSSEGRYELVHQTYEDRQVYIVNDDKSLVRWLKRLTRKGEYLVQQGIPLATYKGRSFDLRVLMQKNGKGNWITTGIGVRVAGQTAISTHVPMGGSIANIHQVLNEVCGRNKAAKVLEEIDHLSLSIAQTIEKAQSNPLGEMSMDLALDRDKRLWFFEANAKPMKFDEPEIRDLSLKQILQYSAYLSGFRITHKKEA